MLPPENDISPFMPTAFHAGPSTRNNAQFTGQGRNFLSRSPVADECERLGVSIYDRHAVYANMQRECHPAVICRS